MPEQWEVSVDTRGTPTLRVTPAPGVAQAVVKVPTATHSQHFTDTGILSIYLFFPEQFIMIILLFYIS